MKRGLTVLLVAAAGCGKCGKKPEVPPQPPSNYSDTPRSLSLEEYDRYVYGPGPNATFEPTTANEHTVVARLIPKLFEGSRADRPLDLGPLRSEAAQVGFAIEVWMIEGGKYWALVESRERPRGAGAYIFRVAPPERAPVIVLQAPHAYFDVGTGKIAAGMFFTGSGSGPRPRALFTNTIHRYQRAPGDKQKRKNSPSDVAHNPDHLFSAATEALAIAAGRVRVIQLHGFGSVDDDDESVDTAMVVSAGDESGSTRWTASVASRLRSLFGDGVMRFPEDIRKLGATTNAQNRLLRRLGGHEFLHVEMAKAVREQLAGSRELRDRMAAILFDSEAPP